MKHTFTRKEIEKIDKSGEFSANTLKCENCGKEHTIYELDYMQDGINYLPIYIKCECDYFIYFLIDMGDI